MWNKTQNHRVLQESDGVQAGRSTSDSGIIISIQYSSTHTTSAQNLGSRHYARYSGRHLKKIKKRYDHTRSKHWCCI